MTMDEKLEAHLIDHKTKRQYRCRHFYVSIASSLRQSLRVSRLVLFRSFSQSLKFVKYNRPMITIRLPHDYEEATVCARSQLRNTSRYDKYKVRYEYAERVMYFYRGRAYDQGSHQT